MHASLIHGWKKQLLARAESIFAEGATAATPTGGAREEELYDSRLVHASAVNCVPWSVLKKNQVWSTDITYIPLPTGFCG